MPQFISQEHLVHHNALEEGVREFDEYMESEYGSPAEESPAMRAALEWYDKALLSLSSAKPLQTEILDLQTQIDGLKAALEREGDGVLSRIGMAEMRLNVAEKICADMKDFLRRLGAMAKEG